MDRLIINKVLYVFLLLIAVYVSFRYVLPMLLKFFVFSLGVLFTALAGILFFLFIVWLAGYLIAYFSRRA